MSEDDEQLDERDLSPVEGSDAKGKAELDAELDEMDAADSGGGDSTPDADAAGVSTTAGGSASETKYCTDCGAEISRDAEICPECGVRQEDVIETSSSGQKESGVSAVLSFLLPGVGQLYNGQVSRGAVVFLGWMIWEFVAFVITTLTLGIFFLIWIPVELFVHVAAAYDAYDQAEKINAGTVVVD